MSVNIVHSFNCAIVFHQSLISFQDIQSNNAILLSTDEAGQITSQLHSQSTQSSISKLYGAFVKSQSTVTVVVLPTLFEVTDVIVFQSIQFIQSK
jgi:hypothetical protein